jgi:hypothetical protein
MQKSGQALATWHLGDEYGFTDYDGTRPHWENFYKAHRDVESSQKA